jgi:hypothetical protein
VLTVGDEKVVDASIRWHDDVERFWALNEWRVGRWAGWCTRPQEQKFFASFFQKRSACLRL